MNTLETLSDHSHSRFSYGNQVRVVRDVRNDGSFFGVEKGQLLVAEGAVGEVRGIGWFLQDQLIYEVYFPHIHCQIGLREAEVMDASLPWYPCRFRSLDWARLAVTLAIAGQTVAAQGEAVQVLWPWRDADGSLSYDIQLADGQEVTVPDRVLLVDKALEAQRWTRKKNAI